MSQKVFSFLSHKEVNTLRVLVKCSSFNSPLCAEVIDLIAVTVGSLSALCCASPPPLYHDASDFSCQKGKNSPNLRKKMVFIYVRCCQWD